jgi:hypothetical protein
MSRRGLFNNRGASKRTVERNEAERSGVSTEERKRRQMQRRRIMQTANKWKKRGVDENLSEVLARSTDVKVTKCPVGAHAGWTPSWMK